MPEDHTEYFECACFSPEHALRFDLLDNNDDKSNNADNVELSTTVFLGQHDSFIQRVWLAIKYIFGYKCRYGHFDCYIMRPEDADRFIELFAQYKIMRSKYSKG